MEFLRKLFGRGGEQDSVGDTSSEWACGSTDVGKKRTNNEDYFLVNPKKNLHIVADGMGGHNAGEVASRNAAESVNRHFSAELLSQLAGAGEKIEAELTGCLLEANEKLLEMAAADSAYRGMGCTIVVALIQGNTLYLSHVGDARAYVTHNDDLKLLTTDHSKVMSLVEAGQMTMEEARNSPLKNELNQAIGSPVPITPDYTEYSLKSGEKVLLCSDGLWDMLSDGEIHRILRQNASVKTICAELVSTANAAGGHDNITVVVVEHKAHPADLEHSEENGSADAIPDPRDEHSQ
jgi:protein phosphatase